MMEEGRWPGSAIPSFRPHGDLPVQVFMSILEHEHQRQGSSRQTTDRVMVDAALECLTGVRKKQMDELRRQSTWADFRQTMIKYFREEPDDLERKVGLLQSLFKGQDEDCHHYLIRVRHVAGLVKTSVACQCPSPAFVDVGEWTKVLFLAGLSRDDKASETKTKSVGPANQNILKSFKT